MDIKELNEAFDKYIVEEEIEGLNEDDIKKITDAINATVEAHSFQNMGVEIDESAMEPSVTFFIRWADDFNAKQAAKIKEEFNVFKTTEQLGGGEVYTESDINTLVDTDGEERTEGLINFVALVDPDAEITDDFAYTVGEALAEQLDNFWDEVYNKDMLDESVESKGAKARVLKEEMTAAEIDDLLGIGKPAPEKLVLTDEEEEELLNKYNELAENFYGLGAEEIEVEYNEGFEPWILAYYVIDNDLHNTYKHEDLISELEELNKKTRFFDEASDFGSGILGLYLGVDTTVSSDVIEKVKEGLKQVPAIIEKYYKEKDEASIKERIERVMTARKALKETKAPSIADLNKAMDKFVEVKEEYMNEEISELSKGQRQLWNFFEQDIAEYVKDKGIKSEGNAVMEYISENAKEIVNNVLTEKYDLEDDERPLINLFLACPIAISEKADKIYTLVEDYLADAIKRCLTIEDKIN